MPLRILHLSYRLLQPFFIPGDQYHYGPILLQSIAHCRPIPEEAPVTMINLSSKENGFIILPLYHLFYNLQMEQYP